ncbi:NnrS family protein [Shewanella algae]|uniref:NnrS family protein n=1 Tax=Shewanella algae TaxID=38313 RepID=UPI001AAC6A19|nr:NnrS family protein [Shewanella algae]MBO2629352.1 NnrS family protein [Shewanella algae]MCE9776053.1 NnrS family protein [Shewanella algae]QTE97133.1 NnrS family protein [Shewanella algae]
MLNIDEPANKQFPLALFRLGFRPFFLGASLFGLLSLLLWGALLSGQVPLTPHVNPLWWHGHEMLFGFTGAVIAGFLLTAVQNWTGVPGIRGWPLLLLWCLWLAPRLLLLDAGIAPFTLVMLLDLAFFPVTALLLGLAVIRVKQWRNLVFVPLLLLLFGANLLSYLGLEQPGLAQKALQAAALLVILLVALLGGRVIPFFTERATGFNRKAPTPLLEALSFASLPLMLISLFLPYPWLTQALALLAGVSLLLRWARWGWRTSLKVPLLWSLHLSYLCIPIGLLIIGVSGQMMLGFHALTVGGMGGMILAMMARVSLGHSGRPLQIAWPMIPAFGLILLAAILRVTAAIVPQVSQSLLMGAIICWLMAFATFVLLYAPILCRARLDGRPG